MPDNATVAADTAAAAAAIVRAIAEAIDATISTVVTASLQGKRVQALGWLGAMVLSGWGCGSADSRPQEPETTESSAGTEPTTSADRDTAASAQTSLNADGASTDADTAAADGDQDPCAPGSNPAAQIGHGQSSFVPLQDQEAELIYGVQGGFHIVTGVRATGLDSSDGAVARLRGIVGGRELGSSAPFADLRCRPDGSGLEALGLLLIWDVTPEQLHQQIATVELELTDAVGTVVTATAETLIVDPN